MKEGVKESADRVLRGAVEQENGVPGVVAMATDREGNFYEGAEGSASLAKEQEMTTDTVFAIFSCTKASTGVAVKQLVEEGEISSTIPRRNTRRRSPTSGFWKASTPTVNRGSARRPPIGTASPAAHRGLRLRLLQRGPRKYGEKRNVPSVVTSSMASLNSCLLFDPASSGSTAAT